ncbi:MULTISPECIES: efflux RND transporter periplasmic adaptor subunit [Corallococcus]|uniref:efflux RND transporter periplasmic adaptor subunit n=1 Tax=Corallococcus TaxID=83461 RepID=UPI00118146A3|nr:MULTISPECIES: efflux RND transporter periplasmic adaptor subunit [Corallococcus]NBD11073.1 efflux RND transporter periplasmic adaptor subunit [Corallococcus silvisoli]TSC26718.1 efflux RND transporter periplasmic adaptor subunit [Corallococcus sp. Z5C101001]
MSRRKTQLVGAVFVLVAVAAVAVLYLHRRASERAGADQRQRAANLGPTVLVTKVEKGGASRRLTLPGEARPFLSTTLYAKIPGYLREINTDKGLSVKKGDVLAILWSPETEQDVRAAETDFNLRRQLAARAEELARVGVMSRQDHEVADAQLRTSMETLRRTRELHSYQVIEAPFSGLVTARYADPGALIPAATGSTQAAQPIVDLADTSTLRITVYLGQDAATSIRVGDPAVVWTDDQPNRRLQASVSRISGQLEPRTRTMLSEIWLDNRNVGILPGTFVHVEVNVTTPPFPTVPDAAVIVRSGQVRAAVVENNKIRLVPISIGTSDGTRIQVKEGLKPGELVASDLPAELDDGAVIQPVYR